MSGGYGPGGYPGQGYEPDPDPSGPGQRGAPQHGSPQHGSPQHGGQQQRGGSLWQEDHGYAREQGHALEQGYPQGQGNPQAPGYPQGQGNPYGQGHPQDGYPQRQGYPGEQGYGDGQDYASDRGYPRQEHNGAGREYDDPANQGQQSYDAPGYEDQAYDRDQAYAEYADRDYRQPPNNGYPQGAGEYRYQDTGPQPGHYGGNGARSARRGTGGLPEYDQPRSDQPSYEQAQYDQPRYEQPSYEQSQHDQAQYEQPRYDQPPFGQSQYGQPQHDQQGTGGRRALVGQGQAGPGPGGQGDYDNWDTGDADDSFMPGFGGTGGRPATRDARDARYDDQRRAARGTRRNGGGPAPDEQPGLGQQPGFTEQAGYGERGGRGQGGAGPRGPRPGGRDGGGPRDPGDWDDQPPRPRKKVTRWFPRILVLSVVAILLIGGSIGGLDIYHVYESRYHPADYAGAGSGAVVFQVETGDTAFSIAPRLYQMGIIASQRAFTNAAENAATTTSAGGAPGGLQAGYYNLHLHMQASLAYAALTNPENAIQTAVTIPEGKRVSQVLSILAAKSNIPLSQFEAAAKETSKLGLPSYAGTTVKLASTVPYGQIEGYLFPATYTITPHETALQILQAMVSRYNVEAQQVNITQAAASAGLTPATLIVEASMVQAEAGLDSDMPKMASVISNRKAAGMPDGFDSVVFYGLGKYGINIPNGLNPATAGLYDNTQKPGLPPTPIDNPGDAAIQAVLHPAKTNYLYFLTVATGKATEFSNNCHDLPGTC